MTVRDLTAPAEGGEEAGWEENGGSRVATRPRATRPEEGAPMPIVPTVRFAVKQRLLKHLRRCDSTGLKTRLLIVINLLEGRRPLDTAHALKVHRDTVYRVAR